MASALQWDSSLRIAPFVMVIFSVRVEGEGQAYPIEGGFSPIKILMKTNNRTNYYLPQANVGGKGAALSLHEKFNRPLLGDSSVGGTFNTNHLNCTNYLNFLNSAKPTNLLPFKLLNFFNHSK